MPMGLFTRRRNGQQVIIVAVHFPTKRSMGTLERWRLYRAVAKRVRAIADTSGVPVVVLGDFNDRHATPFFAGFRKAAGHGVDLILTRKAKRLSAAVHERTVKWIVSDHGMPTARLRLKNGDK